MNKAFLFPEKKLRIVGRRDSLDRILAFLKESIVGPSDEQLHTKTEISRARQEAGYFVDLRKEMDELAFKIEGAPARVEDFLQLCCLSEDDQGVVVASLGDATNVIDKNGLILLQEDGEIVGAFDANTYEGNLGKGGEGAESWRDSVRDDLPPTLARWPPDDLWNPPTFGVTFLGTSHGFDHVGDTTGFILWVNGSGIVVDPPTSTVSYLRDAGLPLEMAAAKIILTHCHADHDSGLAKLLAASTHRPTVYTTKTVMDSYTRKLAAISSSPLDDFFRVENVPIGEVTHINGAQFEFDYSLHSIPCVRFICTCGGKTISYVSFFLLFLVINLREQN
jgi:hypothetical protein